MAQNFKRQRIKEYEMREPEPQTSSFLQTLPLSLSSVQKFISFSVTFSSFQFKSFLNILSLTIPSYFGLELIISLRIQAGSFRTVEYWDIIVFRIIYSRSLIYSAHLFSLKF